MLDWIVELHGEESDLDAIANLLRSERLAVSKAGDVYHLRAAEFAAIRSAEEVRERARLILQRASAAERIRCGSSLPIQIGEVVRIEPDATRRSFLAAVLEDRWNVRVRHAPVTEEDSLAFERWLELSEVDTRVDKALRILITRETTWANLYNILEVVVSDVGRRIWIDGWASESDVRNFKRTAHSESTLGDEARHGAERTQPPTNPMLLVEADSLVRRILRGWLESKSRLGQARPG